MFWRFILLGGHFVPFLLARRDRVKKNRNIQESKSLQRARVKAPQNLGYFLKEGVFLDHFFTKWYLRTLPMSRN